MYIAKVFYKWYVYVFRKLKLKQSRLTQTPRCLHKKITRNNKVHHQFTNGLKMEIQ